MSPKISIIMGIYNCASTLEEALDSILVQAYQDWELIMCDDGSTDDTYSIAHNYYLAHPDKIILLRNDANKGLNYTLNKCLLHAKGEYIARMDGDDRSLPERFQKEVGFLDTHPEFAIVATPMFFFDENGIWGQGTAIKQPTIRDFVFHAPFHCHGTCMIRRDAFLSVGGYTEDKKFLRYEDCNLWYRLYSAGFRGYNLQEPLYMMRDDQNAFKRRTFSSRLRAVYVQYAGFKMVHMPLKYYPCLVVELFKGIILSIIPKYLYDMLHRSRMN